MAVFRRRAILGYTEGDAAGFIASVIGAILLLLIYRLLTSNRRVT